MENKTKTCPKKAGEYHLTDVTHVCSDFIGGRKKYIFFFLNIQTKGVNIT